MATKQYRGQPWTIRLADDDSLLPVPINIWLFITPVSQSRSIYTEHKGGRRRSQFRLNNTARPLSRVSESHLCGGGVSVLVSSDVMMSSVMSRGVIVWHVITSWPLSAWHHLLSLNTSLELYKLDSCTNIYIIFVYVSPPWLGAWVCHTCTAHARLSIVIIVGVFSTSVPLRCVTCIFGTFSPSLLNHL